MLDSTAALATCLVLAAPSGAAEVSWRWTPETVVDTIAVGGVTIAPDGASVAFGRSRWRSEDAKPGPAWVNLWRVPFAGGEPQRLTTADAEDASPRWAPDGRSIAFLSRRGGENAKTRIWLLPGGGEASTLSDEKTDVLSFEWAPDGRSIAYLAVDAKSEQREKDENAGKDAILVDQDLRPRRLHLLEVATRKAEPISSLGDLSAWDFVWAHDGSAMAASVTDRNRTDDSYMLKRIVVLPLEGRRRELVPALGKVGPLAWSPDGRTIAWLAGVDASDPTAGSLFVVPAAGGEPRNLTGGREETAVGLAWRKDGRIAVTSVKGTRTTLAFVDPASGAWEALSSALPAVAGAPSWSHDGMRYAFAGSAATHAPDVYAGSAPEAARAGKRGGAAPPRRIVNSNPQLDGLPQGTQETIRYAARDGLEIEAVLVRPAGFQEGTRHPLIVVAHGGPESQYLDGWNNSASAPAHMLAERGYLVVFPNYRGSAGRGVAYAKADHRDLGGKEFGDVLAAIDFLAAKGWADEMRVGIMGGSYGGYFTALGVTKHSERFAAGIELFGITNWESFLGQSDIPVENSLVHWNLWCYEHAELCRDRSPVAHIGKARTPTLILQGEKDERVPKPQSDELYAALRWKQVPVEYVVYPREPHGFRERWHRLDALTRIVEWMEKYLEAR